MNQEIFKLLKAALECSVFINPTEPGLTYPELLEIGKRAGYQAGETSDAAMNVGERRFDSQLILPGRHDLHELSFYFTEDPEYRNFAAFDFVISQLNDRVKADGVRSAQLQRGVLVERANAAGILRHDMEVAIACQIMTQHLDERDGVLSAYLIARCLGNPEFAAKEPEKKRGLSVKRDMDLIRAILFRIEKQPRDSVLAFDEDMASELGHSIDEIEYNLLQMEQGGLIEIGSKPIGAPMRVMGVTWAGHDFLDSVRDPETWAKTKKGALAAGGFTLDLLKDLAKGLLKKQIEDRTGVSL